MTVVGLADYPFQRMVRRTSSGTIAERRLWAVGRVKRSATLGTATGRHGLGRGPPTRRSSRPKPSAVDEHGSGTTYKNGPPPGAAESFPEGLIEPSTDNSSSKNAAEGATNVVMHRARVRVMIILLAAWSSVIPSTKKHRYPRPGTNPSWEAVSS
jgi:hypothetical protein